MGIASNADLPPDSDFLTVGPTRIVIFTTSQTSKKQLEFLRSHGVDDFVHETARVDLTQALHTLKEIEVDRLMVEGGATLNFEFLRLGLVDELTAYVAPMVFGGETAPTLAAGPGLVRSAAIPLKLVEAETWEDGGVLLKYKITNRAERNVV